MIKEKGKMDLTTGSLWDKIILFAVPLILMNMLQQLFNTADIAVVGRLIGNEALAAVGCTGPVITLFINIYSGLAVGANAVLARRIGEKDEAGIRQAVHTSLALALAGGILTMAAGEVITRPLLTLIGTPENVMEPAVRYLRIYFAGSAFIMLYNFEAAILRAAGDTKRPLYILTVSGVLNLGLNLFFVLFCGMRVEGVALATLISNLFSSALLFYILQREEGALCVRISKIRFYRGVPGIILMVGIPSAVQGVLFNIGNLVIQSGVNSLGAVAVAGATVGSNIETFPNYVVHAFGQACITFNGQNLGAHELKRCMQSTRWCLVLGCIISLVTGGVVVSCRHVLAGLFTVDEAVIRIAGERIVLVVGFQVFRMITEVMSGALRGLGYSLIPTILSVFFVCGVRVLWLFLIFPLNPTFFWLFTVIPVSCALASVSVLIAYLVVRRRLTAQAEPLPGTK